MSSFLIVTDHVIGGRAKATVHFLAEELAAEGGTVYVVSTGVSQVSKLRGDVRWAYLEELGGAYLHNGIDCRIPTSMFRAQNFRVGFLNRILGKACVAESTAKWCEAARSLNVNPDYVLVESGYSISAYRKLRSIFPKSRFIYWVSDDPVSLRMHPLVLEADRFAAEDADYVFVSSPKLVNRYARASVIPKGISVRDFARPTVSPFKAGSPIANVVSVGTMLFDRDAVEGAAELLPQFCFHVIGPQASRRHPGNLMYHGILPFDETVPFIQHCDIGLAPYFRTDGAEYLSASSLKINQYAWCGKPVVIPAFASRDARGFYAYKESDARSLANAILAANHGEPAEFDSRLCVSWPELTHSLLEMLA